MGKYDNIIEIYEVIDAFSTVCVQCESQLEEQHFQIHYRPQKAGLRLVIPICHLCLPVNPRGTKKIVIDYIGDEANDYGLVI